MATFEKASQVSLKGVEITVNGVVTEATATRVMFRSSRNDRVICELVSTMRQGNPNVLVGQPLTVIGKVRGRGMLGNVTLDQCSLQAPEVAPTEVANATPEETASPEEALEEAEPPVATAPLESTDAASANAIVATAPSSPAPVRTSRTVPVRKSTDGVAARPPEPSNDAMQTEPAEPNPATPTDSVFAGGYWRGVIHTLLAIGIGVVGVFVMIKINSSIVLRRTAITAPTTPEMRRAALEQLLMAKKGKK
jgi:hypothetical protein